jgi:hypothetical protein
VYLLLYDLMCFPQFLAKYNSTAVDAAATAGAGASAGTSTGAGRSRSLSLLVYVSICDSASICVGEHGDRRRLIDVVGALQPGSHVVDLPREPIYLVALREMGGREGGMEVGWDVVR